MAKIGEISAANDYLPVLRRLVDVGLIQLDLDIGHLNQEDSPVTMSAAQTRWVFALILGTPAAGWFFGGWAAVGLGGLLAATYWFYQRPRISQGIRRRVAEEVLTDYHRWSNLWRYGGLILHYDGTVPELKTTCTSPADSWIGFVTEIMNADSRVALALQRHGLD